MGYALHARLYSVGRAADTALLADPVENPRRIDVQQRIQELRDAGANMYPSVVTDARSVTCRDFRQRYAKLKPEESRIAGSRLVFFDLVQDGHHVQVLCNSRKLDPSGVSSEEFKQFYRILRRGDIFCGSNPQSPTGHIADLFKLLPAPHIERLEEKLPKLLSPSLHRLPEELRDRATRIHNRQADLLVNPRAAHVLRLRSYIIQYLRNFLLNDQFVEVNTPILADIAGGAIARPFKTSATEFPDRTITLRIAPELWLKRLILGGIDRVFEIGPSFRNEGLDATHNPEFTTCEFYKSFASLEDLIHMTETLFSGLAVHVQQLKDAQFSSLPNWDVDFTTPFRRIDFIPAIENAIGQPLPDLGAPAAASDVLRIFQTLNIEPPTSTTLPRLLDHLSSLYLEPLCVSPTFITHHPECLSPLAKSSSHVENNQAVSSRVELFIGGREIVNAYEEENSPFEQRRKFEEQLTWRDEENRDTIDESYLEALEWGLPPTGGWGLGVDRLCMVFCGVQRINEVLSFGNLRNVVGLTGRECPRR
ncbi:hypothetical protein FGG08_002985 [Glutinoglossum americanum]|uniref:Aminoacyl-transfer RNA synthetases class-II family profile domain-containing protein n=1 Tax=Glutinoglossum americanum TaxID=1670608 RepID=A0A9P8L416_9PEZI|nr:hypothetical protein FGG08_002985 [Glutinoglossum americanum]